MEAEIYAEKHNMGFYEISPLVNFNITESFQVIYILHIYVCKYVIMSALHNQSDCIIVCMFAHVYLFWRPKLKKSNNGIIGILFLRNLAGWR